MLGRCPDFDDGRDFTFDMISLEMCLFRDDSDHIFSVTKRLDIKSRDALVVAAFAFQFAELAIEIDERPRMATD